MLLLITTAWAAATQHANTRKLVIIIIYSLSFFLLLSCILLSYIFIPSYFVKPILLFTTTASTTAAQHIAKIKPKIIIILILSSFVILNLFYLVALPSAWLARLMPEHRLRLPFFNGFLQLVRFNRCKGNAFCVRTQVFCKIISACLIFIDIHQRLVLNLRQRVSLYHIWQFNKG